MRNEAKYMALGGVTAALAITVMSLGTLIPLATYVCPMLCMLLLQAVLGLCGSRTAWAWYGAVAILSALLCPDKEAAAVFVFLGYYPIVKPRLDQSPFRWLYKLLLFNAATALIYSLLIFVLGMDALGEEFRQAGLVLGIVTLALGNMTFLLLDRLLGRKPRQRRHRHG